MVAIVDEDPPVRDASSTHTRRATTCDDRQLVAQALDGCEASMDELTRRYLPLVRATARRHHRSGGPDHDDVVSIANVGLLKAVRDYDLDRDVPFAAYAKAKVRGEVLRWFRDSRYAVHVPRTLHETFMQTRQASAHLTTTLGREPTVDEVAAELGASVEEVLEAMAVSSVERARTSQLAASLHGDMAATDQQLPEVELRAALTALPGRTRLVLYRRYWEGVAQREIGDELGVSQAHVSRIERAGLATLRDALTRRTVERAA